MWNRLTHYPAVQNPVLARFERVQVPTLAVQWNSASRHEWRSRSGFCHEARSSGVNRTKAKKEEIAHLCRAMYCRRASPTFLRPESLGI